jgi:hypothetical protein
MEEPTSALCHDSVAVLSAFLVSKDFENDLTQR